MYKFSTKKQTQIPVKNSHSFGNIPRLLSTAALTLHGLCSILLISPAQASDSLTIVSMGGYRKPVLELVDAFKKDTGLSVDAAFGHIKQIETQAAQNPDVTFVIGDKSLLEPTQLIAHFYPLGTGRLTLVTSKGKALSQVEDLSTPTFNRIAIPHSTRTVFGRAASACLKALGLTTTLEPKLVEVEGVPQVGSYLVTGEVDAGFINKTEAIAIADRTGSVIEVPTSCYSPIEISLGTVKNRSLNTTASQFQGFLQSDTARRILDANGL
ncbi:molybdate ABC transporter substrate-binding protein [Lampropedia puyangensis]|uniref:Molybdate ABC transporter substrate-binding protein n=1 Tax=Lampropedia puyangensis TaxID=1330072 RepID=A0A4S8F3S6_9BURK|nr:molybdate ABC transporter substrate-binding protein [Lampropedia puyangensis]THU02018.1 molybdate ABC transporter substrate-binding protein [Lampropedia puyangensis]